MGHQLTPALVIPGRAEIPNCDPLEAEIFGVDNTSCFYIGFTNHYTVDSYKRLYETMEKSVRGVRCMPKHLILPGTNCILEYKGSRGGIYVRGRVLKTIPNSDDVECILIDDYREVVVHRTQLFHTNDQVQMFPEFALKCRVAELDCFTGFKYAQTFYNEYLAAKHKSGKPVHCTVKISHPCREIPLVMLITREGLSLGSILQEYIPVKGKMVYPDPSVPTKVSIVHADNTGKMYFQFWRGVNMIDVVKDVLRKFQPYKYSPKVIPVEDSCSWKRQYLIGSNAVSVVAHGKYDSFHRVQIEGANDDGIIRVYFMDYGFSKTISEQRIYSAHHIEPNLCFIPPQCLAIKFSGASDYKPFDTIRFKKYTRLEPVSIVLKDYGICRLSERLRGLIVPEVDILIRTNHMPLEHQGYSLTEIYQQSDNEKPTPPLGTELQGKQEVNEETKQEKTLPANVVDPIPESYHETIANEPRVRATFNTESTHSVASITPSPPPKLLPETVCPQGSAITYSSNELTVNAPNNIKSCQSEIVPGSHEKEVKTKEYYCGHEHDDQSAVNKSWVQWLMEQLNKPPTSNYNSRYSSGCHSRSNY